jgi:hypothetical protein
MGLLLLPAAAFAASASARDPRNLRHGLEIPSESGYADQPYIVVTHDGQWLCTLTTGKGREGRRGQHVVSTRSSDRGKSWTPLVDIEPAGGPEASWVIPLVVPSGRVYVFYDFNGDEVNTLGAQKGIRADMLGWYVCKYSDDDGRSWSPQRYRLPMRVTACDRANDWQGKVQIFWGIDKPKIAGSCAIFGFTKLGKYILNNGEGWLFRSDNILTEPDATKIRWQLLPEGDHGIRAPEFGSIQEEHNIVALSGQKLYCAYRTATGHPCHSYSSDGGHTWTAPEFMTYSPGGRKVRNPRACPKLWRTANGKFLFWFHNNGHESFNDGKSAGSRNIAWLAGGLEIQGKLYWSQPEIVLYDPNPLSGPSYPDLVEQDGRYWISETQKTHARVHELDPEMLEGLWNQESNRSIATKGQVLAAGRSDLRNGKVEMPRLPNLKDGGGFAIDLWITLRDLAPGQIVLDSRDGGSKGIALTTSEGGALRLDFSDGLHAAGWDCDPGLLQPNKLHHVVFIVDGGPKVISAVVDGVLCDGGENPQRKYGYGRFVMAQYADKLSDKINNPGVEEIGDVTGGKVLRIAPSLKGQVSGLRIYDRYLRTSEAVGNFHAGL